MRRWPAALLPILILAGCFGSDDASSADPPTTPGDDEGPTPLQAPVLAVGDWWNFTGPTNGDFTLVVAADAGGSWTFAADNKGTAFYDARNDLSYLGPQRKSDLAGSQGTTEVEFFRFPMKDNATWTTTWDQQAVSIVARREEGGAFRMTASNATGPYATYVFDPAVKWMRELSFLAPDGSLQFAMTLQASGNNYTGTVDLWQLEVLAAGDGRGPLQAVEPVNVAAGVTDLYLDFTLDCVGGLFTWQLAPAPPETSSGSQSGTGPCNPAGGGFTGVTTLAPAAGSWNLALAAADQDPAGPAYDYELLARTLTSSPVPLQG